MCIVFEKSENRPSRNVLFGSSLGEHTFSCIRYSTLPGLLEERVQLVPPRHGQATFGETEEPGAVDCDRIAGLRVSRCFVYQPVLQGASHSNLQRREFCKTNCLEFQLDVIGQSATFHLYVLLKPGISWARVLENLTFDCILQNLIVQILK